MVKARRQSWRRGFGAAGSIALGGSLVVVASCGPGFMDGLTGPPRVDGGDATTTVTTDGGMARACTPAHAPERPDGADSVGEDLSVVFAFETVRADTLSTSATTVAAAGIDLDGLCTCSEARSCLPRDAATPHCDGPEGRDNSLGFLVNQLSDYMPQFKEDFANTRIRNGQYTVLIDVQRWNGTEDDPNVVVSIRNSQGLDSSPDTGSGRTKPAFDGTDVWTLDPASLTDGDSKLGLDCRDDDSFCLTNPGRIARGDEGKAYIRGGVLVARFGEAPIVVRTAVGALVFEFLDLTLIATLSRSSVDGGPTTRKLVGEFVGRWPDDKMLPAFANMENVLNPASRLCQDDAGIYNLLKDSVCNGLDLPSGMAGNTPCTAVSSAVSFVAGEARPASLVFRRNEKASPCESFKDDCSK